jgi:hypothetical protein
LSSQSKWTEFFPAIVSKARTVDVLVNGMAGRSESLVLVVEQQLPPPNASLVLSVVSLVRTGGVCLDDIAHH